MWGAKPPHLRGQLECWSPNVNPLRMIFSWDLRFYLHQLLYFGYVYWTWADYLSIHPNIFLHLSHLKLLYYLLHCYVPVNYIQIWDFLYPIVKMCPILYTAPKWHRRCGPIHSTKVTIGYLGNKFVEYWFRLTMSIPPHVNPFMVASKLTSRYLPVTVLVYLLMF